MNGKRQVEIFYWEFLVGLGDTLAAVNATLNGTSAVFLVLGWWFIRQGQRARHKRAMLTAFAISCAFLVSYLTRVAISGTHTYPQYYPFRSFYLILLASHVLLAATVPFLAVAAITLALKNRLPAHRKVVRWALPVWLYVSVTGVLVYVMLYGVAGV